MSSVALGLVFLLGIGNFALHRAVIESGHPMIANIPWLGRPNGARISLGLEFLVLLAAMLLVGNGATGWAWAYGIYSMLNALGAWLITQDRI